MAPARFVYVASTVALVLLVLGSPILLIQLVFVFGYRAFLEGITIGLFPLTIFFLQRTAEHCVGSKSYSEAFLFMAGVFVVHAGLVWYAYENIKNLH